MKYEILEIGEHKMPIRFGFNALRKYSVMTGATMNDLNKLAEHVITKRPAKMAREARHFVDEAVFYSIFC